MAFRSESAHEAAIGDDTLRRGMSMLQNIPHARARVRDAVPTERGLSETLATRSAADTRATVR
jgi:hypothetical protein